MVKKHSPLPQEQLKLLLKTAANAVLSAGPGGKGINLFLKKGSKLEPLFLSSFVLLVSFSLAHVLLCFS